MKGGELLSQGIMVVPHAEASPAIGGTPSGREVPGVSLSKQKSESS